MPFEVGCVMVRDGAALERAFELHPEYLQERPAGAVAVNFADRGLQLSRSSRAIKVWLAIQTFGTDAFREAIDRAMDLTVEAQRRIEADPRLELVTPASLGVLTFRRRGAPNDTPDLVDRQNKAVVSALAESGDVLLTSTMIGGRYAIRLCILNHSSGEDDVVHALERVACSDIRHLNERSAIEIGADRAAQQAAIGVEWQRGFEATAEFIRSLSAFQSISDEQASRFLGSGREETYAAGQLLTERWALARTFYVVLEGRLSVRIGHREVNVLGPGDHLGEISAIDWGRDFSYGRTATVEATEAARVLAFPAAALRDLMSDAPDVDRAIRRIAQARVGSR